METASNKFKFLRMFDNDILVSVNPDIENARLTGTFILYSIDSGAEWINLKVHFIDITSIAQIIGRPNVVRNKVLLTHQNYDGKFYLTEIDFSESRVNRFNVKTTQVSECYRDPFIHMSTNLGRHRVILDSGIHVYFFGYTGQSHEIMYSVLDNTRISELPDSVSSKLKLDKFLCSPIIRGNKVYIIYLDTDATKQMAELEFLHDDVVELNSIKQFGGGN